MAALIRPAEGRDEAQWRKLWHDYNSFYKTAVPAAATEATWARILDSNNAIQCIVAEENSRVAGFIHYVIHPRTWDTGDSCYMEDLYVDESARGKGMARALCTELKALCTGKNVSRIYWHTQEGNKTARALYDQIGRKDDFVRYVIPLKRV